MTNSPQPQSPVGEKNDPIWFIKALADMEAIGEGNRRFFAAQEYADEHCHLS